MTDDTLIGDDTPTIDVRVVQDGPVLGDVDSNADRIATAIEDATDDGVDLVVFPELFLTGYHIGAHDADALVQDAEAALDRLVAATRDLTAVIGAPTRDGDRIRNSAVVLDDGERLGAYHKTHLYGDEASTFEPGDAFPTFETEAGTLGIQICYDVEFPEVSRQLALAGADVLVTVSANMYPFTHDQSIYRRARAIENIRPHVLCNRIGSERDVEFFGASAVVDERGRPVVTAGQAVPIELTATIELQVAGARTLQYMADRRPELYRER